MKSINKYINILNIISVVFILISTLIQDFIIYERVKHNNCNNKFCKKEQKNRNITINNRNHNDKWNGNFNG